MQLTDQVTGGRHGCTCSSAVCRSPATGSWNRHWTCARTRGCAARGDVRLVRWQRAAIVPDNLKTRVISHPRDGEIVLNDAYRELAGHYSTAVLPARVRKAKDKDKPSVENTVGHVATWVIAEQRDHRFATLAELRAAVYEWVQAYNAEPFPEAAGVKVERVQRRGEIYVRSWKPGKTRRAADPRGQNPWRVASLLDTCLARTDRDDDHRRGD